MNHTEEKIIELSKAKLLKIFVLACVFVYLGAWMFQMDAAEIESHRRFNSPLLVHGMGVVAVIFFGLCGLWSFKKLFDNRPGLILDSKGIMDNSSGIAAGLVPWTEITGFRIYEVKKQKMLVILLKSPETYIEMGGGRKARTQQDELQTVWQPACDFAQRTENRLQ